MLLNSKLEKYKIYLASQSPRRKMLLEGLDLNFEVYVKQGIDEQVPLGLGKEGIPVYLAGHKSKAYSELLRDNVLLITADTIVWHNNNEIGKPENLADAKRILHGLSGDMHEVITGVCIKSKTQTLKFYSISKVWFRKLGNDEIDYYLEKYKPFDKAGSYGIQEWIGYIGIDKIEGSFYNVMGLPVQALYEKLNSFISKEP